MQTSQHTDLTGESPVATDAWSGLKVFRLSGSATTPGRVIGLFAHNEGKNIRAALSSIASASGGKEVAVYVLANGCSDNTCEIVRSCTNLLAELSLVEIARGDKANAWNLFVHNLFSDYQVAAISTWFFMDADVTLVKDAMLRLEESLEDSPHADAAGGMPGSGREMEFRRRAMDLNGMLAGNFYALRGSYVERLRDAKLRMPIGFIGEDLLLSWMVANIAWSDTNREDISPCVFNGSAEFTFRSLSPLRLGDWKTYARRKWRYAQRDLQYQLLIEMLVVRGLDAMPHTVDDLYERSPRRIRPRLRWLMFAPFRFFAASKIMSRSRDDNRNLR